MLLIDTETTGFDPEKHQLLEVGILVLEQGEIINSLNIKLKHKEYVLTAGAMKANKIDIVKHEEYALSGKETCEKILKFLECNYLEEHYLVVGQNVDFDIKFIEKLFLMQLFLIRNIEGKIKAEKQDLDYILNTLNIEIPTDRHSALKDCFLEYEVLKKLLY